ncbi:AAA family ATPase [Actinomadura rubrisoli]|uniref:DNA primase n=1 Tax=Actinomadura rubrisoli TaxID=2530368 RepID=A0A4R5A686_9ACTN|nr:AAA family ATPase [Actinomadura rubrisoli]TDD65102.1 DNA primase [Actinomadura rubrisoli]
MPDRRDDHVTPDDEHVHRLLDDAGVPRPRDLPTAPPPADGDQDATERRTWQPVDLTDVLAGRYEPAQPTVGRRDDGVGLFYPGRMHSVAAESEAGKTWLMLAAAATEMQAGHGVVYVDFEDDEGGVVGRLLALAVRPEVIASRFGYVRPEVPITLGDNRSDLAQALGDLRPTLAVIDGVTEGMVMHGLNPLDNSDAATFGRLLTRPVADHGAAAVVLDHVVKNGDSRGRYALGAVHKLNGLNGAAYTLDNRNPFGVGVTGQSGLFITKDRPGQLRRHAANAAGGAKWFADLVGTSRDATFIEVAITAPGDPGDFRPTVLMRRVSDFLATVPDASGRDIELSINGQATKIRHAVACLIKDGHVKVERGRNNALLHTLLKPYEDPADAWTKSL